MLFSFLDRCANTPRMPRTPSSSIGTRPLRLIEHRGKKRAVPLDEIEIEPALPRIRYADIAAVWLRILRRPGHIEV
jgi:hypothetical protein